MAEKDKNSNRRDFLKLGLLTGGATLAGAGITKILGDTPADSGEKVKVLTPDGKLVEVDSSKLSQESANPDIKCEQVRKGLPGMNLIMVIDLARCGNARKCVEGCQKMHHILPPTEWIKVKRMQDTELTAPYWFPQPCYHCDNPPCTKVCPVDATFKNSDGLVGIDNERCIGCKFCMAACPYNARTFNFGNPKQRAFFEEKNEEHECHTGNPAREGTVSKCDFCPGAAEKGELPACVTECPNGVIFFGNEYDDSVTNGEDTFRLTELLRDRAAYRQFEELGTKPRVYYLPPVNRNFPFEEAKVEHNTGEQLEKDINKIKGIKTEE